MENEDTTSLSNVLRPRSPTRLAVIASAYKVVRTADRKAAGKPELAQAGGNDNGKLAKALALAKPWVENKLKN